MLLSIKTASYESRSSYVVVVAIDFGTTYSGYAFSFIKNQGKDSIFMNRDWTNDDGVRTSKTPTCLLLKSDLSFDSFGYEAVQKYAGLQGEGNAGKYLFFQHFKMVLHSDETVNTETTIKASNGQLVKAKTVFATSINFFKKEALKVICTQTGDDHFSANDILWVLTVPAIWTPRAKQFMREAAYEAGLGSPDNPNQVMIALEPEAAAIACLTKDTSEFKSETGRSSVKGLVAQPNTHYMVVDIGGGTLDVTVHAIQDDGTIKEIHKATGGPYGGIYVNRRFESLLDELFGAQKLLTYQKQFPSDWLRLMSEFEAKKKGERVLDDTVMINIRLPRSFVSLVNQTRSPAMARYEEKVKLKNDEYLALSSGVMQQLFSPVLNDIKKHLKTLQTKPELSKVKIMFLVGGFADSALLRNEIKREFSGRFRVLTPDHANIAVVQGAAIFGKKPEKITERVVPTTYGAGCSRDFIPGVNPEEKKFIADGIEMCRDLFKVFVKENAVVQTGEKISSKYTLLHATDTEIKFPFYASTNPDVEYTTDPGMTQLGSVEVTSPETWRGKDREIEVSMYFGGTEINSHSPGYLKWQRCPNHP
ncbi:hypothetical protein OS493_032613 [Desmophyllum pertusum]|uniref:Heat shock 70 kDa protein 12A n=1 Tax=Desmophyllum pertusum TaxID=174260 RepID=A0A9W9YM94_9CNID|nr:hypothetical protein OS493_032613 [Desmophyllum pertusum]